MFGAISPILGGTYHEHYHFQSNKRRCITPASSFSFGPHPLLIQRGGILPMLIHFPMGLHPSLAQKGEGGMCLKCPPPPPPRRSTYELGTSSCSYTFELCALACHKRCKSVSCSIRHLVSGLSCRIYSRRCGHGPWWLEAWTFHQPHELL